MLPNVEERALPVLGQLTAEDLGLDVAQRAALTRAQALPLPVWKRTSLGTFDLAALKPAFGTVEIEATPEGGLYVADLQTALVERPELVVKHQGTAVAPDFKKFV